MNAAYFSIPDVQQKPLRERSVLLLALLASLLVHGLLSSYFLQPQDDSVVSTTANDNTRPIELRLLARQSTTRSTAVTAPASSDGGSFAEPRLPSDTAVTPDRRSARDSRSVGRTVAPADTPAGREARLNLSLPQLEAAPSVPQRDARSATVFDPKLSRAIRESQSRSRVATLETPSPGEGQGSLIGGRWQSFVKIGQLCFEVIQADPLDSLSIDQWFPRACD